MNTKQPQATEDNKNNKGIQAASTKESPGKKSGSDQQKLTENKPKTNGGDNDKKTPAKKKITHNNTTPTTHKTGNLIAIFALLIAFASLIASYILWQQSEDTQHELAIQSDKNQSTFNKILPGVNTFKTDINSMRKDLSNKFDQELKTMQENMENLYAQSERAQDGDWILAEAEYLLNIANHRLQLEHDVNSATIALNLADKRLQTLAHPALTPVRSQISDELSRLNATSLPDTTGMGLTLSSLQETVTQLPLIQTIRYNGSSGISSENTSDTNQAQWKVLLHEIWHALKGLVTIRRTDDNGTALLPPEQYTFLVQNLQLKLESARLALFRGEDTSYHDSLKSARNWINTYFDTSSSVTNNLLGSISTLDAISLDSQLPNVSGSLTAIRELIKRKALQPKKSTPSSTDIKGNTTNNNKSPLTKEDITPKGLNNGAQQ